jgi:hypothetical protein
VTSKAEATADKLVMTILELEHAARQLRDPANCYAESAANRAEAAAKEARSFMARTYEWAHYLERS